MTLDADEFICSFLLQTIPPGFQRICHYGLCANRNREVNLKFCRELLKVPQPSPLTPPRKAQAEKIVGHPTVQSASSEPCCER